MTKLTVRYIIDGQQADETEIDQSTADDARELIGCIKDAVGEILSDAAPVAGSWLRDAIARAPSGDGAAAIERYEAAAGLSMKDVEAELEKLSRR